MAQHAPVELIRIDGKPLTDQSFATVADSYVKDNIGRNGWENLTTTKLRTIYGMVMNVSSKITDEDSFAAHVSDIQYLKVRMAYEAGREPAVKAFLATTKLMEALDKVETFEKFALYCRYAESLVAYFKFYGGKE